MGEIATQKGQLARYAAKRVQSRMDKPVKEFSGELALVEEIRRRAEALPKQAAVRVGIGDDCAILRLKAGEELAVTTDLSLEGRHFRLEWHPAEAVGHRALARGLSDLAAMGARPISAFLSLAVPAELTRTGRGGRASWMDRFLDGMLALAARHGIPLAGGDISESPIVVADIVLTGAVPRGQALLRSGARPGDRICVTGRLGGAAVELAELERAPKRFRGLTSFTAGHAHLYPEPRLAQGVKLRGIASAAMDLSDGLSVDLARLCRASGVAAAVVAGKLPLGAGATVEQALNGGEDYELLVTIPAGMRVPRQVAGLALTVVGEVVAAQAGKPVVTLLEGGVARPLQSDGWQHFTESKR